DRVGNRKLGVRVPLSGLGAGGCLVLLPTARFLRRSLLRPWKAKLKGRSLPRLAPHSKNSPDRFGAITESDQAIVRRVEDPLEDGLDVEADAVIGDRDRGAVIRKSD